MKIIDTASTFGPFNFITNENNIQPVLQEMYKENHFLQKIVDNNCPKVDVLFGNKEFEEIEKEQCIDGSVEGFYSQTTGKISIRNNSKYFKTILIHEYIHFIQDLNIRKTFPGLTMNKIYSKNTLYNFVLSILFEADAYTKEYVYAINIDYINKYDMGTILKQVFGVLLYKYTLWGYAENFDFVNMDKNIFSKEKFMQISECILKSLSDEKYGGKIFPQYDLDWNFVFGELKKAYISNKHFDIIAITHDYLDNELAGILNKKFSKNTALIKNFLLNFKGPIYRNYGKKKKKFISLPKQNCYQ